MLTKHRDDYCGIFRSLALVNCRRVGWYQHIKLPKPVGYRSAVKAHGELCNVRVNIIDVADVAVVDFLVVVVFDLHHLVAGGESPAEPLDLSITRGIECGL